MTLDPCAHAEHRLQPYLDRALDADEVALVEAHLAVCAYCNDRYLFEAALRTTVRSCCSEHVPSDLVERLRMRLRGA
jgi:anti-sigma factor (TIGR02949 family)